MKLVYIFPLKLQPNDEEKNFPGVTLEVLATHDDFDGHFDIGDTHFNVVINAEQTFNTPQAMENALDNHKGQSYFLDLR
jgi:hypothetical protein